MATVGRLKRSAFKKPDKVPYTYDHRPFALDGKMELNITFDNCTMRTPVYVKMDAHDPLLLSEGVCHQLGIISYRPSVDAHDPLPPAPPQAPVLHDVPPEVVVPVVRVKLIQTVRLPPMKSTVVLVQIDGEREIRGPVLLEPLCESAGTADEIQFPNSLLRFGDNHSCYLRLVNPTGFTQKLENGSCVGHASEVE